MSKYIIDWDSFYVRSCRHEDAERYGDGLYCVYFWEDDDCNVFYVGSGKGYRFNSVNEKPAAQSSWSGFAPNNVDRALPRMA